MPAYNYYTIDFNNLAAWLTPKAFRKEKFSILMRAVLYPLIYVHDQFMRFRKAKIYQIKITPQVCYLEQMLNDKYDYTLRRIYITDAVWHLPVFFFQEAELKPVMIYTESEALPVPLYTDGEAGVVLNDFIVVVPVSLSFIELEMKGSIDSYKLFGTKYSIQRI